MLDGGLKCKIEINWSEISAMKAYFPKNQPGILEIQLSQVPSFQQQTDLPPRRRTLWQPTSDFTGGQAPICRRHSLQFHEGVLEKHYKQLLQCDERLLMLSESPFPFLESHYFNNMNLSDHQQDVSFQFNGHQSEFDPCVPFHQFGTQSLLSAPCHQVQMLGPTSPPLSAAADSTSTLSFTNFNAFEENVGNHSTEHLLSSEGTSNSQNFHMGRADQVQEFPSSAYANQVGSVLPRSRVHSLASEDGLGSISTNNWAAIREIEDYLLNDEVTEVFSDEKMLLDRMKSMHSLLDTSKEQNLSGQSCTNDVEDGRESSRDNQSYQGAVINQMGSNEQWKIL